MKKYTIRNLQLYTPVLNQDKKTYTNKFNEDYYLHFTVILNDDGSIWKHGTLYLLSKLKQFKQPDPKTLDAIAADLINFMKYCKEEDIDYLSARKRILRPTYRYRNYLENKFSDGLISANMIRRRMGSVVGFYQYLVELEGIHFKFPLWESSMTSITMLDKHGFKKQKQVESKDVSRVVQTKNNSISTDRISDGGNLKPLTKDEQEILFTTLQKIGNTEMTLAMLIAVTTGARIQTVFTLRLKQFEQLVDSNSKEIAIDVGYGTLVDTKFGKRYQIKLPCWIYQKIKIYIDSSRYKKRFSKAKHIFKERHEQYVFLTTRGVPYYAAKSDKYRVLYKEPPNGNSVRQFIGATLKNYLKKEDTGLEFSFHDLRATYGMNLLEQLLELVDQKKIKLSYALMFIKDRMNHSQLATTEGYLKFRETSKIRNYVQDEFEKYLKGLLK